ncbi:MAG: hypothetical protein DCC71_07195 [Proteobacteria bacterium]|nr:MAG: hypothetical protein DCC71_07195 [Pseudomonadota bacterium]
MAQRGPLQTSFSNVGAFMVENRIRIRAFNEFFEGAQELLKRDVDRFIMSTINDYCRSSLQAEGFTLTFDDDESQCWWSNPRATGYWSGEGSPGAFFGYEIGNLEFAAIWENRFDSPDYPYVYFMSDQEHAASKVVARQFISSWTKRFETLRAKITTAIPGAQVLPKYRNDAYEDSGFMYVTMPLRSASIQNLLKPDAARKALAKDVLSFTVRIAQLIGSSRSSSVKRKREGRRSSS